jgi:hypothetical protein
MLLINPVASGLNATFFRGGGRDRFKRLACVILHIKFPSAIDQSFGLCPRSCCCCSLLPR